MLISLSNLFQSILIILFAFLKSKMLNSKVKFHILISLFVLTLHRADAKCEMTYDDLDNCALKSNLFGNPKWKVPETEDELTEICR